MKNPVVAWLLSIASQLRFPWLLALTVGLLLADLVIPDLIPFVDEILLSLTALVLASFRKPRKTRSEEPITGETEKGKVIDVEPVRDASGDPGKD
jgi:hypothetical protein